MNYISIMCNEYNQVFCKKTLKKLQYSQENTCIVVSFFLINMQAFRPASLLKRHSNIGVFLAALRIFQE